MAITSLDGLVAAFPGTNRAIQKQAFAPQATGAWTSLWEQAGIPGAGVAPSSGLSGDVPTDATAGAFPFTNSGMTYLGRLSCYTVVAGTLLLYDRLVQTGEVDETSTSGQTMNTTAITRPDATGFDVEAWWQVYTTMGAGTPTVTLTYTDQDGNGSASASSGVLATTLAAKRTGPFALASGDTGVRSVQTWTASATFTSGSIGLVLRRHIATLVIPLAVTGQYLDPIQNGLPRIYDDAAIELIWYSSATTSNTIGGGLQLVQG